MGLGAIDIFIIQILKNEDIPVFQKVDILIYEWILNKSICTKLMAFPASEIIIQIDF